MAKTGEGREQLATSERRAGFAELLFDVVLVFALSRLSDRLIANLTWSGLYRAVLLFLAIWWLWYRMAWTNNRYDPNRPLIQSMVIATMLASLLMAAAVPRAYGDRGLIFAGVYVALQVLRHAWLLRLRRDRYARLVTVRILFWTALSGVPWIAGALTADIGRVMWWTVAVLIDYAGGLLDFPTPRLGTAGLRTQPVAHEHLTERCRQLVIIALGETILTSGIQFSPRGFQPDRTVALLVSFAITVLLWQIYFYRAGALLPAAIASSTAPAAVGELAGYAHLTMVLGVTVSSVGDNLIIEQPFGETQPSWIWVIFGGPALFLIGRALLDYAAFSRVSVSRPIGLILLAALAPVALQLPPVVGALIGALVLAAIAIYDGVKWRWAPPALAPPRRLSR